MTSCARVAAALLGVWVWVLPLRAQTAESDTPREGRRPVVGLVLSGGGARGFAHLGVLKVLHEMRVPVDVIAGTSMGAVVGGVYATGLTYPELEALVRDEDWDRIFEDDPPRAQLSMRRKRFDRNRPLDLELGVTNEGLRLPPSLIAGAKLTNALQAYTYRASGLESFDDLPIPFRAVAMDIGDGSAIVLDRGNLGEAVRASMAVPGAFSPQRIDDRVLVDGGLVRNIPLDVARAMGAEVLIVSDVSTTLEEAPDPDSPIAVAQRLLVVVTTGPNAEQLGALGDDDIYVRADLTGISSADFATLDTAMIVGEAAARAVAGRLTPLVVSEEAFREISARRASALPPPGSIRIDSIAVDESRTSLSPGVVEAVLRLHPGDTVSAGLLRDRLTRLVGYGGFQNVEFRLEAADGGHRLEVRPVDKSWGPIFLRPAVSLTDQQRGTGAWSLRGYLESLRLTSNGGALWGEIEIGTRHGLKVWTELPLESGQRVFLYGSGSIGRSEVFPEVAGLPLGLDASDRQLFAGLGISLGSWGDVIAGASAAWNRFFAPPDVPNVEDEEWNERALEVRLDIDVLDRVDFPSSGFRLRADWVRSDSVLGGNLDFEQVVVDALAAVSSGHLTLTASLLSSSGLGTEVPFYRAPPLGGVHRLTGLERDALWGGYALVLRSTASWRLDGPAGAPGGGVRLGVSAEAGQAQATETGWRWPPEDMRWGGSAWLGLGTPIGPIILAYGGIEDRRGEWVVQVGVPR